MKIRKKTGIILTVFTTVVLIIIYIFLENYFYSDIGCGCSSSCIGYYPTMTSRIIGYSILIVSFFMFIVSVWRVRRLSKLWIIPSLALFGIAFYGNGYMIFNKGGCGYSLNKTTFFINQIKLGDYAKEDAETINLDSLKIGKYKGKLLGYSINENELTAFRIGETPVTVKTSFLFWKIRTNVILNDISHGLNTYRNLKAEKNNGHYEFIGGKGMTENDFINEFVLTNKCIIGKKIKNKRIINETDGTTRFKFEIENPNH